MRRLRALIRGLPYDSAFVRTVYADQPAPAPAPAPAEPATAKPQKIDVKALRKFGGEVIAVPRGR